MTDNEINLEIAEACGWKFYDRVTDKKSGTSWDVYAKDGRRASYMTQSLPNYCTDLNAMHEVEKIMDTRQQDVYAGFLGKLTGGVQRDFGAMVIKSTTKVVSATARQRAEAFLRTIEKWKE
jgi:hypothetical protein